MKIFYINSGKNVFKKIKYLYWDIIPYWIRPYNILYYLKCKFYWKYNRVICKYLSPTWHDRDQVLLYSCFQILCDFIEEETPFKVLDFEYDERHKQVKQEMESLYFWWIDCHTNRTDDDFLLDKTFDQYKKVIDKLCKEQELPSKVTKDEYSDCLIYNPQYKDYEKWCEYVDARYKLDQMHEEFINRQLVRLIQLRGWMWT